MEQKSPIEGLNDKQKTPISVHHPPLNLVVIDYSPRDMAVDIVIILGKHDEVTGDARINQEC